MVTKADLKILSPELLRLEQRGEYEKALAKLTDIWHDTSLLPDTKGLEPKTAAELLLRCGSLIGFDGHLKQVSGSQENSRNLLTRARDIFLDEGDEEKIAECENHLALAYWRTGELIEGETWIEQSLSRDLNPINATRIHSHIVLSMLLLRRGEFSEVISYLGNVKSSVTQCNSPFLIGMFWNNRGIAFRNKDKISTAIECFELSAKHHRLAKHKLYLATVENNLALCFKGNVQFAEAHAAVDRAINIYVKLGDKTRRGSSLDTKAQIFFDEGNYSESIRTANQAIALLRSGENSAYHSEAHFTKSKALLFLDAIADSALALFEAMEIARVNQGEKAEKQLALDFEAAIRNRDIRVKQNRRPRRKLRDFESELVIPTSLSVNEDYQVIRIRNSHLEKIGIRFGDLALVVNVAVQRGDLIAVKENFDESIICGFYDYFAGIISVSGFDSETLLLKKEDVEIIGKVVGTGSKEHSRDGKIRIKPIQI